MDVRGMRGPEKLALDLAMPVLVAEEELRGPVADDRLYDVVLRATGSEDQAAAALTARAEARLRRGETPDI